MDNFDKAIIKISKKNGFKFKSDYIKSLKYSKTLA